jgi:hypothetical protein
MIYEKAGHYLAYSCANAHLRRDPVSGSQMILGKNDEIGTRRNTWSARSIKRSDTSQLELAQK